MKKMEMFLLLLLVGLAGCCRKRCEPVCCDELVEECSEIAHSDVVEDIEDNFEDGAESVRSFFNEETEQFETDLEEWVFAEDLDFPTSAVAENSDTQEEQNKSVEVAATVFDDDFDSEKKNLTTTVSA